MDMKIIEAEIIKALECCKMPVGSKGCKQCPLITVRDMRLTEGDPSCTTIMLDLAIDLINRQKAEIERLEKANESFSCMGKMYSEIKSEVRKEFAERLCEGRVGNDPVVIEVKAELAEMEREGK